MTYEKNISFNDFSSIATGGVMHYAGGAGGMGLFRGDT
jgi:hypothetical protein